MNKQGQNFCPCFILQNIGFSFQKLSWNPSILINYVFSRKRTLWKCFLFY